MAIPSWATIQAMGEPFTRSRLCAARAVLDWIDGYGSLVDPDTGGFRRVEFFDYETGDQKPVQKESNWRPRFSDLPCLSVEPAPSGPQWTLNQQAEDRYVLAFRIWTRRNLLWQGERLTRRLLTALWQCCPSGSTVPYIKTAIAQGGSGHYPGFGGSFSNEKTKCSDGGHARVWTLPIFLRVAFNPMSTALAAVNDDEPS